MMAGFSMWEQMSVCNRDLNWFLKIKYLSVYAAHFQDFPFLKNFEKIGWG
jgi:hypothetical protein